MSSVFRPRDDLKSPERGIRTRSLLANIGSHCSIKEQFLIKTLTNLPAVPKSANILRLIRLVEIASFPLAIVSAVFRAQSKTLEFLSKHMCNNNVQRSVGRLVIKNKNFLISISTRLV